MCSYAFTHKCIELVDSLSFLIFNKSLKIKEIVRHMNFKYLPSDNIDLVMKICRKDKYHLIMKDLEYTEHSKIGDDILQDVRIGDDKRLDKKR